uniref:DNA topoisomerase 2 n=1 Tax=Romanomermis culicivorax TaxID=13658 RepID=A0A915KFZ5_ROMCU
MFLASCSLRSVYYSCRKSAFIANVFGRQLVFDNSIRRSLASKIQVDTMDPSKIFQDIEEATDHGKKRLSIEQIYQKKSQLEHILLRPDTYIGSVEMLQQQMWIYNSNSQKMECRDISYVPGLYKIFDEIIVNAADNKQRDNTMTCIRIDIDADKNRIRIWNNGRGIPVVEHKHEKMYVPELIFGTLLTSSNYDDSQRKVTVFGTTWTENMSKTERPDINKAFEEDFTCVTFEPDLKKFKMDQLDDDIVSLMNRRAFDVAGTTRGVKVYLNGKKLPIQGFKDYVDQYTKDILDDNDQPIKTVYEQCSQRWEVAITTSEKGFQQISFVNSIATTKIKNHMWVFVNSLIENPTFDSQTKETMTLQAKSFGSKCTMSEKFLTQAIKCGVVDKVMQWVQFKAQTDLNKKCHASKHSKLRGIAKLEDANDAGTKNSIGCTLILTEGDSAKTLAVAGLGVIGRDRYGIMENAEVNNVIKILGLQYKKKYQTMDDMHSLRYGKVMIMTDQ